MQSDASPRRLSAATLTVPKKSPIAAAGTTTTAALFDRLRGLIDDCEPTPNKHDLVTVLITACIEEGVNTGTRIIGTLTHLGFNNKHVAMMLKQGTGHDPEGFSWCRNHDGTLTVLT